MSTLKNKAQSILNEKELKIIPENIKEGVQIFDVTGICSGGDNINDYIEVNEEGKYSIVKLPTVDLQGKTTANDLFNNLSLKETPVVINSSEVTDMSNMYAYIKIKTGDIIYPLLDTSSCENFASFCNNTDIVTFPSLDTSNGINFDYMFAYCEKLIEFPPIDLSNAKSVWSMFNNCKLLTTYNNNYNLSNLQNISNMFQECTSLTSVTIDLSNCTSASSLFYECNNLRIVVMTNTGNIENWDSCFSGCSNLDIESLNLDLTGATDVNNMFENIDLTRAQILHIIDLLSTADNVEDKSFAGVFNKWGTSYGKVYDLITYSDIEPLVEKGWYDFAVGSWQWTSGTWSDSRMTFNSGDIVFCFEAEGLFHPTFEMQMSNPFQHHIDGNLLIADETISFDNNTHLGSMVYAEDVFGNSANSYYDNPQDYDPNFVGQAINLKFNDKEFLKTKGEYLKLCDIINNEFQLVNLHLSDRRNAGRYLLEGDNINSVNVIYAHTQDIYNDLSNISNIYTINAPLSGIYNIPSVTINFKRYYIRINTEYLESISSGFITVGIKNLLTNETSFICNDKDRWETTYDTDDEYLVVCIDLSDDVVNQIQVGTTYEIDIYDGCIDDREDYGQSGIKQDIIDGTIDPIYTANHIVLETEADRTNYYVPTEDTYHEYLYNPTVNYIIFNEND